MADDITPSTPKLDPKELTKAFDDGRKEGRREGLKEIFDWLEDAYINNPGRPDRGTPKAEAILELAGAATEHFRKELRKLGPKE